MRMIPVKPTGVSHTATVIFFHGSGDTGKNLREWVFSLLHSDMVFPHIKVIYPSAPAQPYTLNNGQPSTVWFDRKALTIDTSEDRQSVGKIYNKVSDLIQTEQNNGIKPKRIIVGGFSMGGALAMHTAYHLHKNIGGVFTCSSFLNRDSIVYDTLKNRTDTAAPPPELLMFHGSKDGVIPLAWAQETYKKLKSLGVNAKFTELHGTAHELTKRELLEIQLWIGSKLPLN